MNFSQYIPSSFFQWCDTMPLSVILKQGYTFAVIETVHILGFTVLLGTIAIVELRVLGLAFEEEPMSKVAKAVAPWTLSSLILMAITGFSLFITEATKLSTDVPFFVKIVLLVLALLIHFTIYQRATRSQAASATGRDKLTVGLSLTLWLAIAFAGRAIAFI